MIHYAGYIQQPQYDRAEYTDWLDVSWRDAEHLQLDLDNGNLPRGLVLRDDDGVTAVVSDGGLRRLMI